MHAKPTPIAKRRPSLMQLFRLHLGDRTNTAVTLPSETADSASRNRIPSSPKIKKEKKEKKKIEADVDEAELVRVHGQAFVAEVALLQFLDGGSTAHNVQRALKKRAKLSTASEGAQL